MALKFPQSSKFVRFALTGLLATQATIATAAISALVSTDSVSAQEVKINDQSAQLFKTNKLSLKAMDLMPPQAAACWTATAQNCSYRIHPFGSVRINPYLSEQLNALPNFDVSVNRLNPVRISF